MNTSIILDLETLSRQPNALITEIGVLAFDRRDFSVIETLLITPDIFSQLQDGRHACPQTIAWHRSQNTLPTTNGTGTILADLTTLHQFFTEHAPQRIWIQGPDFDRPILENLCQSHHLPLPWDYWRTADSRTTWNLAFPGTKHPKRPHSALGDCHATLRDLHASLTILNRLHAA